MGVIADAVAGVERLDRRDVERLAAVAVESADPGGFAGPALAGELQAGRARAPDVGGRTRGSAGLARPPRRRDRAADRASRRRHAVLAPGDRPLAGHRSQPTLAGVVDVLIVGAGLTGASAAYHLAGRGLRVAVVDAGDPAGEASGRNGGHFELVPENSIGEYRGLARERLKFVRRTRPRRPAPRAARWRSGRRPRCCG
jgi:NADPH-dependent 2,4-dienoyl-CoA reductase/sulfur reductase-like enzyme